MAIGYGEAAPKHEPRKRTKNRKDRAVAKHVRTVRKQVFADHDDECVVCRWPAESMHELRPASLMGNRILATNEENSVPVCGSGTTKCHGLLQRSIVRPATSQIHGRQFWMNVADSTHPEVIALLARIAKWTTKETV